MIMWISQTHSSNQGTNAIEQSMTVWEQNKILYTYMKRKIIIIHCIHIQTFVYVHVYVYVWNIYARLSNYIHVHIYTQYIKLEYAMCLYTNMYVSVNAGTHTHI